MKAVEAVRKIMDEKGVKVADMAFQTQKKSNVISERLTQENISMVKLSELLRVLNYKVVIIPREAKIPDGGYEIE